MRCTTELTARFDITITALPLPTFAENCDAPIGSIEYWEAFERDQAREDVDLLDALDFDTVPFDSVVEDLSMEMFEQDAAEDRAYDAGSCECKKCGLTDDWDDGLLTYIAGEYRCAKCMPTGHGEIIIMKELHERRRVREHKIRAARAKKFREALEIARTMRPDLNWAKYEYDPRRYA